MQQYCITGLCFFKNIYHKNFVQGTQKLKITYFRENCSAKAVVASKEKKQQ